MMGERWPVPQSDKEKVPALRCQESLILVEAAQPPPSVSPQSDGGGRSPLWGASSLTPAPPPPGLPSAARGLRLRALRAQWAVKSGCGQGCLRSFLFWGGGLGGLGYRTWRLWRRLPWARRQASGARRRAEPGGSFSGWQQAGTQHSSLGKSRPAAGGA